LDLLTFLSKFPTPIWIALSGIVSGIGTWIVSIRKINASIEQARIKMIAGAASEESAERAAFRTTLMAEISSLRQMIKECETEKVSIRERVNRAEEQILVLNASNEIMEKWVAFFKDRNDMDGRSFTKATPPGSIT
jgi:transposase